MSGMWHWWVVVGRWQQRRIYTITMSYQRLGPTGMTQLALRPFAWMDEELVYLRDAQTYITRVLLVRAAETARRCGTRHIRRVFLLRASIMCLTCARPLECITAFLVRFGSVGRDREDVQWGPARNWIAYHASRIRVMPCACVRPGEQQYPITLLGRLAVDEFCEAACGAPAPAGRVRLSCFGAPRVSGSGRG